jgi:hypothetical protein
VASRLPSGLTDLLHPDCFWSQARACLISGVVHGNGEAQPFQPVPWEEERWECLGSRGHANPMAKTNIPLEGARKFVTHCILITCPRRDHRNANASANTSARADAMGHDDRWRAYVRRKIKDQTFQERSFVAFKGAKTPFGPPARW